jgi:hypothetical protein
LLADLLGHPASLKIDEFGERCEDDIESCWLSASFSRKG